MLQSQTTEMAFQKTGSLQSLDPLSLKASRWQEMLSHLCNISPKTPTMDGLCGTARYVPHVHAKQAGRYRGMVGCIVLMRTVYSSENAALSSLSQGM